MGRGKLNIELIANEKSRMITYQKRKKGLTKKVQEFHILCDVDACIIIFGPNFNNRPVDIETWPSDRSEMRRIISRYQSQRSDCKRNQDLSHFFVARKKKIDDDIAKLRRSCFEAKYPPWDNRLNLLQLHDLSVLEGVLESKIEAATARILNTKSESDHYFTIDPKSGIVQGGPINNLRPNPMATTFANALIQKNLELEAYKLQPQPFSYMSQYGHHSSSHHQMLQVLDVNPINSTSMLMMMMMENGDDLNQFGGECSSKRARNVVKEPAYFDPPTSHQQQMVGNNRMASNSNTNNNDTTRAHPVSCYGLSSKQPFMLPYRQDSVVIPNASSHQLKIPPISTEFCDINEFEFRDTRDGF